jgi:Arc/MetJ-type ribon-helix-helix transcriptional regulator
MVRMKSVTVRLSEQEFEFIRRIKEAGFSSLAEVIRCAALSMANSINDKKSAA